MTYRLSQNKSIQKPILIKLFNLKEMKNEENRDSKDECSPKEQPGESQLTFHPKKEGASLFHVIAV